MVGHTMWIEIATGGVHHGSCVSCGSQGQRSRTRSRPTLNDAMDAPSMDLTFHPTSESAPQALGVQSSSRMGAPLRESLLMFGGL